ncbi:MAG TPA: carbamoyltransferase HypF [Miltoncostaeaceae bacterium]|nr:carbamoyltransferase HypF [Miltoncostaeaceae bacterium]
MSGPRRRRVRVRVAGIVQGVGFRPYVYRLATGLGLAGHAGNDERGVVVEAEGTPAAVAALLRRLPVEAPPLAAVERVEVEELAPIGERGFRIVASERGGPVDAPVAPDVATCDACLAELFDPADRRHRYPFVNCTDCGPRFTIVLGVPYDRLLTTMAGFAMCAACRAEYEDPADRRFHAQPNACPACGPHLALVEPAGGVVAERDAALRAAAGALRDGAVVAVKGIGGYHLACRAAGEEAVAALRARKRREEKPFAIMARDLGQARVLAELGDGEIALLAAPERPIVIAPRRPGAAVAAAVAPRSRELGVMLPYSPLHHLLLADAGEPLVMTSGNVSDEPIASDDADAIERLGGIADLVLRHDRPIATRTDDSVVRAVRGRGPLVLRRSRGLAPAPLELPVATPRPLLACGAELKSTFCLVRGTRAWVGHHIGDLKGYETLLSFVEGVEHFERLFAVAPEAVAHDLHPDALATRYALEREGVEHVGVQHHHAHLAACLAEHGETGPAVGAIFDGTGYGTDGTVWGGELLCGGLEGFERLGHLRPVRLPGGDVAVREPWRMACAWLVEALGDAPVLPASLEAHVDPRTWRAVAQMAATGIAAPVTTSMGRLFDAVAALAGIRARVSYEGQAAVELEAAADPAEGDAYPLPAAPNGDGRLVLDGRPTIRAALRDAEAGRFPATIAARFQNAVVAATAESCARLAGERGTGTVVLSGGVFQNRRLLEGVGERLAAEGLRVLAPERLPANDGGISYGQAAVAAARLAAAASRSSARTLRLG